MYCSTFLGLVIGNQVNPIALGNLSWKYYIVFCCILAVLIVIIWFLFPETKGHSLEEIREVFEGPLDNKLAEVEDEKDEKRQEKGQQTKQVEVV
jgi:H+/Cl- antiporter ClcA